MCGGGWGNGIYLWKNLLVDDTHGQGSPIKEHLEDVGILVRQSEDFRHITNGPT